MKYKIIMCGRDSYPWLAGSLQSVFNQSWKEFDVCVVDDASIDGRMAAHIRTYCNHVGWRYIINDEQKGALYNQVYAIRALNPDPDDVIVFVDADDQLAHPGVLDYLNGVYDTGVKMTYGQYLSRPFSPTCNPAMPYPQNVIDNNDYRRFALEGGGIWFNHLRTFKYELFEQLDDKVDFMNAAGEWMVSSCDTALMIPCLELSRGNYKFIDDVLYIYNSENPLSDWRLRPRQVDSDHDHILRVIPKKV